MHASIASSCARLIATVAGSVKFGYWLRNVTRRPLGGAVSFELALRADVVVAGSQGANGG